MHEKIKGIGCYNPVSVSLCTGGVLEGCFVGWDKSRDTYHFKDHELGLMRLTGPDIVEVHPI